MTHTGLFAEPEALKPLAERMRPRALEEVVGQSRLLAEGTALVGSVDGRLRLLLAGFVGGGRAALAAVTAAGHDVLPGPPKPTAPRLLREVGAVLRRAHRER